MTFPSAYEETEETNSARPAPAFAVPDTTEEAHGIVGNSDALRYVMLRVDQVAPTNATVLLLGETGTGKELVARAIHQRSTRRGRPLVVVNCAALPATLIENELFGRERGAFTGAHASQIGHFEMAHRGTLLLDEIGELPLELQPKLLRVLQEGQLQRLGSPRVVDIDVRVIAATNRDLSDDVRQGRFRSDLFYRLNVFPLTLPSLRDRREDIPALVYHLVGRLSRTLHKPIDIIPRAVIAALQRYEWPGNIRELENVLQRAIILSPDTTLSLTEGWLPSCPSTLSGTLVPLVDLERRHIQRVLEDAPTLVADRVQLQQVVLNLVTNAIESMSSSAGDRRELTITTTCDERERVSLHVRDTGVGIGAEHLPRIFDPFFTTKPEGMGMGLSISQTIVKHLGGRLWATPNHGGGATLSFSLPVPPRP